ncbi:MAG TPA: hypothetical protein VJB58_02525 [Candidatus Paceibacterota bacterium]
MSLRTLDLKIIRFFKKIAMPVSRLALFVVFFWFGILKVLDMSPASQVVQNLFNETMPIMEFSTFFLIFGLFECLIGILFLIPGAERGVIPMLFLHMITTAGPLFLLTGETWTGPLVPTLEGQYIIKNLVIVATAIGIAAHLRPMSK